MIKDHLSIIPIILFVGIISSCGKEKTPSRDHIPLIKAQLTRLQEGVRNRSAASIDSVLSVNILKNGLSSDSLLKFVYGAEGLGDFESFGQPVIIYTEEVAKVEAYIMDSTKQTNRPVIFTLIFDDDQWLLTKFEADTAQRDSF